MGGQQCTQQDAEIGAVTLKAYGADDILALGGSVLISSSSFESSCASSITVQAGSAAVSDSSFTRLIASTPATTWASLAGGLTVFTEDGGYVLVSSSTFVGSRNNINDDMFAAGGIYAVGSDSRFAVANSSYTKPADTPAGDLPLLAAVLTTPASSSSGESGALWDVSIVASSTFELSGASNAELCYSVAPTYGVVTCAYLECGNDTICASGTTCSGSSPDIQCACDSGSRLAYTIDQIDFEVGGCS
eukprot:TRINITY_DN27119_c0_g1_i1.p2 TRINITY_DN27119_c0_g1~~TRINITY_DN27119_c0_g1_i1.p2  ORF type:complete len:247 (-),score=31.74 TRINITY_DN27119_c0_g1_i1:256-996(-)